MTRLCDVISNFMQSCLLLISIAFFFLTFSPSHLAAFEWSAWSLCESLAAKKGFFNRKGEADVYRAANFILREVLDGIVTVYFTPPKRK